ncbi:hypothetical protein [Sphingomonas sp. NPDC079357]|uniref:hypothetical protein n=1 Tax=Sphingomonas sp. NPDC079357 TaxID=3364518 RepID=UPI00384C1D88
MSDSIVERLGSVHLEDMAIIALTGCAVEPLQLYPELGDDRRARLRSRIKQVSRHDWPANTSEDPLIRRGYTLRQCCRLIVALMLIDAHLAPSHAIALAKANEPALLRLMVARMEAHGAANKSTAKNDRVAVVLLGELAELVAERLWRNVESNRVRLIDRSQLADLWSTKDLPYLGQRLPLDVGTAAAAVWRWMMERRLMTGAALDQLARQLDREAGPEYLPVLGTVRRR